jgi:hypothetical protein
MLHDDGDVILYVGILVPTHWVPVTATTLADRQAAEEAMVDLYFEAIDTRAGALLASDGPFSYAQALAVFPGAFFSRSDQGYRITKDRDGFQQVEIVRLRVESR